MVYQWRHLVENYKKLHGGEAKVMMSESYSPDDISITFR
jgi:hypothetical protein